MTTQKTGAPGAHGPSVIHLHQRWLRILDRLTGAPIGHGPRVGRNERKALVAEARALERRIADTRAQSTAEVVLKLQTAACPLLISGDWWRLVDSAARDLQAPDPDPPPARPGERQPR